MEEEKFSVSVFDAVTDEKKTIIDLEISDELAEWFRKNKCPSGRWNAAEFRKWFKTILCKAWITLEAGKYKTVYDAHASVGANKPKKGDVVTYYKNGFRSRIVAEVNAKTLVLAPLWEGESNARINKSDVTEITRPRKRLSPTPDLYESE
tara:strand:- start:57914 stop:58363 length:450 start_codon:yes stop_codon:yes gene_type:complete